MGVELLGGVDQGYPGLSALDAEIGVVGCGRWVGEQVVDLAGDVAFQTSDDFSTGLAFFLGLRVFVGWIAVWAVLVHVNRSPRVA